MVWRWMKINKKITYGLPTSTKILEYQIVTKIIKNSAVTLWKMVIEQHNSQLTICKFLSKIIWLNYYLFTILKGFLRFRIELYFSAWKYFISILKYRWVLLLAFTYIVYCRAGKNPWNHWFTIHKKGFKSWAGKCALIKQM